MSARAFFRQYPVAAGARGGSRAVALLETKRKQENNIENHISPNIVRILKGTANLGKIVPSDSFHDADPGCELPPPR
jgi:hypothetical protein